MTRGGTKRAAHREKKRERSRGTHTRGEQRKAKRWGVRTQEREERERQKAARGGARELELAWGAVPVPLRHMIQPRLEAGHVPATNSQPSAPQ